MKNLLIFIILNFFILFFIPFLVYLIDYFTDMVVFACMNKSIEEFNQYRKHKFK